MAWTVNQIWTPIVTGTMIDLDERRMYAVRLDIYGQAQAVHWTEDGTPTGTSLFGTADMPTVEVTVADANSSGGWTRDGCFGAMGRQEYNQSMGVYSWVTEYDSGNAVWLTKVFNGSPYGTGASAGIVHKRPCWLFAVGGGI